MHALPDVADGTVNRALEARLRAPNVVLPLGACVSELALEVRAGAAPDLVARVLQVVDNALAELARAVAHNVEQPVRLAVQDFLEALVILADRRVVLAA